jgi:hypothetical protein
LRLPGEVQNGGDETEIDERLDEEKRVAWRTPKQKYGTRPI